MAYDLVAAEYGWTDEAIGDLPLARLRQITAAIQTRKYLAFREENSRTSWLARQLATFVAQGYMVEGENKAVEAAQNLGYDDIEIAALTGEVPPKPGEVRNRKGSFERLAQWGAQGMKKPA